MGEIKTFSLMWVSLFGFQNLIKALKGVPKAAVGKSCCSGALGSGENDLRKSLGVLEIQQE